MHKTHASHADTPECHDDRQEDTRPETLEQDVCQWFEACVRNEEEGKRSTVFASAHIQILEESFELSIADIRSILES